MRYTTTASCLASGPPRHPPNSLPVSVVQARLICERPQAELSCNSAHASQARALFSLMIIYRFYPAHASCPFSDLPLPTRGLAPADDGLQGIVRCPPGGLLPRLRRREGSTAVDAFARSPSPSARRQGRLSGEPPPQSPSARHILDSHLLQSTAAFFHFAHQDSPPSSGPSHASVIKLTCRLRQSLVCAALAFSFNSL